MRFSALTLGVGLLVLSACGVSSRAHAPEARAAAWTVAAGATPKRASLPDVCLHQERLAPAPYPGESGVYHAGSAYLSVGVDLAQVAGGPVYRAQGSEAIVSVTGGRAVSLRVLPSSGVRFALEFGGHGRGHPGANFADGRRVARFPACGRGIQRFYGGVLFSGRGCARLGVARAGTSLATMLIPIGDSLRGCGTTPFRRLARPLLTPFLGVACGKANWAGCDRIGIGVDVSQPASLVLVKVAGRLVTLSPPGPGDGRLWLGYLEGEGPAHGQLRVHPGHAHLWLGTPEVYARTRVITVLAHGQRAVSNPTTVLLHPGFG